MENERISELLAKDAAIAERRRKLYSSIQASPIEAQVAFLKELSRDEVESKKFLNSPKQYAKEHGIVLSPDVVQDVVDTCLFNIEFTDPVRAKYGENAIKDLIDMRYDIVTGTNANAVAAGAAVAAVVVMAATLAISATRSTRVDNLSDLKGIRGGTIRLPKGATFKARDNLK